MEVHDIIAEELNLFVEVSEAYDKQTRYSNHGVSHEEKLAIYKRVSERLGHNQS